MKDRSDKYILINDVGPRDGLQSLSKVLSVDERLRLIESLVKAKLPAIEVGSFVSPKAVPAMAGTAELIERLPEADVEFSVLVPNMRGYEMAIASGMKTIAVVTAASNTMNLKNINMDIEKSLAVCQEIISAAEKDNARIIVYISTAWECPYEGKTAPAVVADITGRLFDMGAAEVSIADTIGAANPKDVHSLMTALVKTHGSERLFCHFHDTRAMGLANTYAAVESGIRKFDASVGGLGGCPFAPGASGNVATEDVVMMLHQMGYDTGIDLRALSKAASLAAELTGLCAGGRSKAWLDKELARTA